ncbi:hypothetical protein ACWC9T_35765 [Kitasatospora sp. NPDC001159]
MCTHSHCPADAAACPVPRDGRGKWSSRYWYAGGFCWQAMVSWVLALLIGLAFTKCDWFAGPLSDNPVGRYGLAWAATIVLSGVHGRAPRTSGEHLRHRRTARRPPGGTDRTGHRLTARREPPDRPGAG